MKAAFNLSFNNIVPNLVSNSVFLKKKESHALNSLDTNQEVSIKYKIRNLNK
jgi:hypothetical protein